MHRIAEAAVDELLKLAASKDTFTGAALRGAALGAGVASAYGGARGALRERKKRKHRRRYGQAFAEGALDALPKGAVVGGALGWGRHANKKLDEHSRSIRDTAKSFGETAKATTDAVQRSEKHLRVLTKDVHGVVDPVKRSMEAMKREGKARKDRPGLVARLIRGRARRKAGDFLARGSD